MTTSSVTKTRARARTRHTQYTAEAFREIAHEAVEEMIENSDTLELKDLSTWSADLKRHIGRVSDHHAGAGGADDPIGSFEGAEDFLARSDD